MAIKKSDILNYLDDMETQAITILVNKYKPLIESRKVDILIEEGFSDDLADLLDAISAIKEKAKTIASALMYNKKINYNASSYGSVERELSNTSSNIDTYISKCSFEDTKLVQLINEFDKAKSEVYSNYSIVMETVKKMRSSKDIVKYVTELGFDISHLDIEKQDCVALVQQVDVSKLFIKGDVI